MLFKALNSKTPIDKLFLTFSGYNRGSQTFCLLVPFGHFIAVVFKLGSTEPLGFNESVSGVQGRSG